MSRSDGDRIMMTRLEESAKIISFLVSHFKVFVSQIHKVSKIAIQIIDLYRWSL